MKTAIDKSKTIQKTQIVFFDEINTNKEIQGIFKEIIIDKTLEG